MLDSFFLPITGIVLYTGVIDKTSRKYWIFEGNYYIMFTDPVHVFFLKGVYNYSLNLCEISAKVNHKSIMAS